MKPDSLIYITASSCEGARDGGWSRPLAAVEPPPPPADVLAAAPSEALAGARLAALAPDDWLHPLRIQLDRKPKTRELPDFLRWNLKKFLPYPIDDAETRFAPLAEPNAYIAFSLPKPWVQSLYQGAAERGARCGYIGGFGATLLENAAALRGRLCLFLFGDFYLMAEPSGQGYEQFAARRLPFGTDGELDATTLLEADLAPPIEARGADRPVVAACFEPALDEVFAQLVEGLRARGVSPAVADVGGSALDRFQACLYGKGFP